MQITASRTTPFVSGVFARGWAEFSAGLANWRIWHLLGSADLRRRYMRSRLGQFWITLSMAVTVVAMASIFTLLFNLPAEEVFTYIAISLVIWSFVSGFFTEAQQALAGSGHYLTNQGLAASTFVFAAAYKNTLIFAHNAVIAVLCALVFGKLGWPALLVLPAFALTLVAGFFATWLVAVACLRFRDLIQLVQNIVQIAFFLTPVLWQPRLVPPEYGWIVDVNPFAIFLSILRDPLLGEIPPVTTWFAAGSMALGLGVISLWVAGWLGRRLIYWV